MNALFEQLEAVSPLTASCKQHLRQHLQLREVQDKEFLLRPGQICKTLRFVHFGLLRCFVLCNGEDVTSRFALDGELCVSPASFFRQIITMEFMQSIGNSVIYEMDYTLMQRTCCDFMDFRILIDTMILKNYLFAEGVLNAIHMLTPRQRYEWMRDRYIDPGSPYGQYLPSYVGLTRDMINTFRQQDHSHKRN
ncbi:MAG: hypothetical protein ABUL46_00870 [Chitinophaga rupis]